MGMVGFLVEMDGNRERRVAGSLGLEVFSGSERRWRGDEGSTGVFWAAGSAEK